MSIRKWRKRDSTADRNTSWKPGAEWWPGLRKFTDADVALVVRTRKRMAWGYGRLADELRDRLSTPMSKARVRCVLAAHDLAGVRNKGEGQKLAARAWCINRHAATLWCNPENEPRSFRYAHPPD